MNPDVLTRVEHACQDLLAADQPVTFDEVARRAGSAVPPSTASPSCGPRSRNTGKPVAMHSPSPTSLPKSTSYARPCKPSPTKSADTTSNFAVCSAATPATNAAQGPHGPLLSRD